MMTTIEYESELFERDISRTWNKNPCGSLFSIFNAIDISLHKYKTFSYIDVTVIPGILPLDRPDVLPEYGDADDRLIMIFSVDKVLPS